MWNYAEDVREGGESSSFIGREKCSLLGDGYTPVWWETQASWVAGPLYSTGRVYVENQDATCPHTFLRLLHLDLFPGKMGSGATVSLYALLSSYLQ